MTVLEEIELRRMIRRLAMQAVECAGGTENLALVGIRTRGVVLAKRLQQEIFAAEGVDVPLGILDIALYRDDLLTGGCDAVFKGSEISFPLEGKTVILCDDVLYTGRTVRAALAALAGVKLFCLIDRGHRELPFRAEGVGKSVPSGKNEKIVVHFRETDGEDCVLLLK